MKTKDFDYHLPDELIAHFPIEKRSESKLLVSLNNSLQHKVFKDITSYFRKGDLLVLNNTSVIPARIYGKKESGGNVEIMLERIMENNKALVQIKSGRSPSFVYGISHSGKIFPTVPFCPCRLEFPVHIGGENSSSL